MTFRTLFDSFAAPRQHPPARRASRTGNRRNADGRTANRHSMARRLLLEGLEDRRLLAFLSAVSYPVEASPQAVVSADFNGDGRLDLATANFGSSKVSVLLGNADGSFQPALNSHSGAGQRSLAAGDFNADGKLDLAMANASEISVLLGNGNGTFQVATRINLGSSPSSVAVGDFNADGKLDLGVTSGRHYYGGEYGGGSSVGGASVLLGNGDGSFSAPSTTPFGDGAHLGAVVEDFNGDGRDDFAVANWDSGSVEVQLANANGSLGAITNVALGYSYPSSITGADINSDGVFDLVVTGGGNVSVLLGNADGTFQPPQNSASLSSPRSVAVTDFNGDNKPDLVMDSGYATLSVLLGVGTGRFAAPVTAATGAWPLGVAVGDFNADGRMDAASADADSNGVSVLLNDGTWPTLDASTISIGDVIVTEGNTGTTEATFTVSLSAAFSQSVSVHYATADGTATLAGGDYQAASGDVIFAPGETTRTVTVLVNGDRVAEYDEIFYVQLSNPINASIADATGSGTIANDEPLFSIDEYVSGEEGNSGTVPFTFNVTRSAPYDAPATVDYATSDLTIDWIANGYTLATAGTDYVAASGTLSFTAGETSKAITVLVNGDRLAESTEYFLVNLSNSEVYNHQALAEIVNDDTPSTISISDASVFEGNSGTKLMTFTVSLSHASGQGVWVNYATFNGTAKTSNQDYLATSGTLYFAPGETVKSVNVSIRGDSKREANEQFYVKLSAASGGEIADGQGVGTILNDDGGTTARTRRISARTFDAALDDLMTSKRTRRGR